MADTEEPAPTAKLKLQPYYTKSTRWEMVKPLTAWLASGKTLNGFCDQDEMPTAAAVRQWCIDDKEFGAAVLSARQIGFDALAEECLRIADETEDGVTITEGPDGKTIKTEDMIAHRKLRIDTRMRLLAKWAPHTYGDKAQVEHSGGITLQVVTGVPGVSMAQAIKSDTTPAGKVTITS